MTGTSAQSQPPAELHWGISYLREDIQDLRTETRGIHARVDGLRSELAGQIDSLRRETNVGFSRMDTRLWLLTGLILSSWVSLVGLLVLR